MRLSRTNISVSVVAAALFVFVVSRLREPPPSPSPSRDVHDGSRRTEDAASDSQPEPAPIRADNVILITVDTVRADATGFGGRDPSPTPNLDRLATASVVFDRAYALASYTGKSLGPMLIGRYPSETDRDGNHFTTYAESNVFVAERLRREGFATLGVASHWYLERWSGLAQGIDRWNTDARPPQGQGERDVSITSTEVSNAALDLLSSAERTGGPFFLWVHYLDPHADYMAHDAGPDFLAGKSGGSAAVRALYDGELWFTDREIGRLLDFIATQAWSSRTAIIVTSDHGEAFGEHGMSWHGQELWECLVRVPLVIHGPGVPARHVSERRSLIDLAPTLLEIAGLSNESELSGKSLLPDLRGSSEPRDVLLDMPVGPYGGSRRGLITNDRKLIESGGQYRLYDLSTDPSEETDLANTDALGPMRTAFDAAWSRVRSIDVPPGPP